MKQNYMKVMMLVSAWLMAGMGAMAQEVKGSEVGQGTFYLYSSGTGQFLNTTVNGPVMNDYDKATTVTLTATGDGTFLVSGISERYMKLGTWNGQFLWCDGAEGDTKWSFQRSDATEGNAYCIYATEGNYTEPALSGTWYLSGSNATDDSSLRDAYFLLNEQQYADLCEQIVIQALRAELGELLEKAALICVDSDEAWEVYENPDATREELEAAIAALKRAINNDPYEGMDCTHLLVNADFSKGTDGWTLLSGYVKTGGNAVNPNAESWQEDFDLCQQVEGVPNGIYQLDFNGFSRHGNYATSWAERMSPVHMGFAYIGNAETAMADYSVGATQDASVYEHPDQPAEGYYVPNSVDEVARGFAAGLYKNTAYGIVTDGVLRMGLRAKNMGENCWVAWDNFRLTYQGKNETVLAEALGVLLQQFGQYDELIFAQTTRKALQDAIEAAKTATGGDAQYEAYLTLVERKVAADKSVAIYRNLQAAFEVLAEACNLYDGYCSKEATETASALIEELASKIDEGYYDDEEAEATIMRVNKAIVALRTPATMAEASDENPVDCTTLIVNASFDNNDNYGWDCSPQAGRAMMVGAAEYWNCNFDMYQMLDYLPNGTYELSVNGLYRNGWATEAAFNAHLDGTIPVGAYLYAETAEGRSSQPFTSYWDGGSSESLGGNENVTTAQGRTVYGPNDMNCAVSYFEAGFYNDNRVVANVTDGSLKIGISKEAFVSEDWTMFDNFRLTYYGTDSSKKSDNIDNTTVGKPDTDAWYSLQGIRMERPTAPGLYIKGGRKVMVK